MRRASGKRAPVIEPERTSPQPSSLTGDEAAIALVAAYYAAFNARDMEAFFALVTDDVAHDINQGEREVGKDAFRAFMARMNESYSESLVDLIVMANADGSRAAAEFVVLGTYLKADAGLPPARGQEYRLPAGAFFALRDGKIARISNYYNLQDWIAQVARP
jgi:steroid delta-isomerase-like uncharacterized protein